MQRLHLITLLTICLAGYCYELCHGFDTPQEAQDAFKKSHAALFSKHNLLLQPIKAEHEENWNNLLMQIREYVNNDVTAHQQFATLEQCAQELVNLIKKVFTKHMAPALDEKQKYAEGAARIEDIRQLQSINMTQVEQEVQSYTPFLNQLHAIKGTYTLQVGRFNALLKLIADILEDTYNKLYEDFLLIKEEQNEAAPITIESTPEQRTSPAGSWIRASKSESPTSPALSGSSPLSSPHSRTRSFSPRSDREQSVPPPSPANTPKNGSPRNGNGSRREERYSSNPLSTSSLSVSRSRSSSPIFSESRFAEGIVKRDSLKDLVPPVPPSPRASPTQGSPRQSTQRNTPLVMASRLSREASDEPAIIQAARRKDFSTLKNEIEQRGAIVDKTSPRSKNTALHEAARLGDNKTAEFLIKRGASPNQQNKENETPLHRAVIYNHADILKTLINAGADPNIQDINGMTPLMIAAENGHYGLVAQLINYQKTDKLLANEKNQNMTALDYAKHVFGEKQQRRTEKKHKRTKDFKNRSASSAEYDQLTQELEQLSRVVNILMNHSSLSHQH